MNLSEKRYDAEANVEGRFPEGDTSRLQSGKGSISVRGIHYETEQPVQVDIENGMIRKISGLKSEGRFSGLHYIAPGLIDNQVNGYAGIDFSDPALTTEGLVYAAQALWETGVTTFFPTLITNSHENLLKIFTTLAISIQHQNLNGSVPGFHLEGPYISSEDGYRGIHPAAHIRKPSWTEFSEYLRASDGKILQVTLAPEYEEAGLFIKKCVEKGIRVAIGHTSAGAEEIRRAADLGAHLSVHLGNGCANYIHRHHNPIWPQLADDRIIPSIIADGHHLLPEEIMVFYRVKGPDHMILTSDVTFLAGMPPGRYQFAGSEVELTADGALINVQQNCLAGASFPLMAGVGHFMEVTGCSPAIAIHMASRNVAGIYGLNDRGSLTPGKRADFILFEKLKTGLAVQETWVAGERRYVR